MPSLRSDEEAEKFVETADLSTFDLSGFKPMRFEIAKKDTVINLRMPTALMAALKDKAARQGVPYARYVRMLIEADVAQAR